MGCCLQNIYIICAKNIRRAEESLLTITYNTKIGSSFIPELYIRQGIIHACNKRKIHTRKEITNPLIHFQTAVVS